MSSSPIPDAAAATPVLPTSLKVMTVNTHKGFTALNRKFILPELRDAVRTVGADVVFLQEVLGTHSRHSRRVDNWPEAPHYEFLADTMWPQFAYGRNAVYPNGHHGNAVLSKFPIVHFRNHDVSIERPREARPAALRAAAAGPQPSTCTRSARTWGWPRRTASSSWTCCATSCATRCRPMRR